MYRSTDNRFAKVTIYLGFAFILTILDTFIFIIDYQFDQYLIIVSHLGLPQMAIGHLRPAAIWNFYNVYIAAIS